MILSSQQRLVSGMVILAVACFMISGCGGGGSRGTVDGSVMQDGQPVDGGTITFVPEEYQDKATGRERSNVVADIKGGKYAVDSSKGPYPGKYRVEINWMKKTGKQVMSSDPPNMMDEVIQMIPRAYNTNTKTHVEIKEGKNTFDYQIPKINPKEEKAAAQKGTGPGVRQRD